MFAIIFVYDSLLHSWTSLSLLVRVKRAPPWYFQHGNVCMIFCNFGDKYLWWHLYACICADICIPVFVLEFILHFHSHVRPVHIVVSNVELADIPRKAINTRLSPEETKHTIWPIIFVFVYVYPIIHNMHLCICICADICITVFRLDCHWRRQDSGQFDQLTIPQLSFNWKSHKFTLEGCQPKRHNTPLIEANELINNLPKKNNWKFHFSLSVKV